MPDAGTGAGFGHLARCLALGEEWIRRGGAAWIETNVTEARWQERCHRAKVQLAEPGHGDPAACAWTVLDGYDLAPATQARARACRRLAAVDDRGRSHWTVGLDLVVDPNVGAEPSLTTPTLAGARYALVRRDVVTHAGTIPKPRSVVIVGGGSPRAEVLEWMDAVACGLPEDVNVDVVGGGRDLAAAIAAAELVVTAAGTALLEALALHRPVMAFTCAENQRPGAASAAALGIPFVGQAAASDPAGVSNRIARLLDEPERLKELTRMCSSVVDGRGTRRVASHLFAALLDIRVAATEDTERLWSWANDPDVRSNAFSPAPIPFEEHVQWMAARLADQRTEIVIGSWRGTPIGQVRFEQQGDRAEASVGVDRAWRGRGLGGPLLVAASEWYLTRRGDVRVVVARVRMENAASHGAFLDADFVTDGVQYEFPAPHLRYNRARSGAHQLGESAVRSSGN